MRKLFVRLPILLAGLALLPMAPVPASAATTPTQGTGVSTTGSLQQQLQQAQDQLAKLDDQVERARAEIDADTRQLAADQTRAVALHKQLSAIAKLQYQRPALSVTLILNAQSLDELLSSVSQARLVADKQASLLDQVSKLAQRDQQARDQSTAQLASIQSARDQASKMVSSLSAKAASNQQARNLMMYAQSMGTLTTGGPYPNHFTPGQCTWYVASKRSIPWFGNANQWIAGAQQYGFPLGTTPRAGAVMVTAESGYGHVAYVEAVSGDGSWTVSEMNYQGPYVVDRRTIRPGGVPLIYPGFIY
jgi:surface antigen